ncbi:MAG TPA: Crp/Fnr family transcriptional regulator [Candidatus Nanopelagicales bacterium]
MQDRLRNAALFSALDDDAAAALRASMVELRLTKGDVLFSEGEPGEKLFLIESGKIKLGHTASDGRESIIAVLGAGEMLGELSLFDPGPRTATAVAVTHTKVLSMSHEALLPWLVGRPDLAVALLAALARRLRRTNEALADLVFSDVPGRVAKALLELGSKFGESTPNGLVVNHELTQEELAQLVGASRETVNKALADFSQRGWITIEQRSVTLLDVDRLERRAR